MARWRSSPVKAAGIGVAACALVLATATALCLKPIDARLRDIASGAQNVRVIDRNGVPLDISYQNRWNVYDHAALYEMPEFLVSAFIVSEDKRFYSHGGVDWRARAAAVMQDARALSVVRGASTITEQVVRLVNPRPRTLWSRWLEGFEAQGLERTAAKADILEFYLNQVPFAGNRRGVVQAARATFGRDLSTLSRKEMLALAVMVRAPSVYDPFKHPERLDAPIARLAARMEDAGYLTPDEVAGMAAAPLVPTHTGLMVDARHFTRYARLNGGAADLYRSTLDAGLQKQVQGIVDARLAALKARNVHNAAALVADWRSGEILAWVVGGAGDAVTPAREVDAVVTPRQPGSALKPFLYARALDKGWSAATMLDDAPLTEAVGAGLHNFRNYSNTYYGPVSLREALGNSLNIPALLAIRHVGAGDYLTVLQKLGFDSLSRSSDMYDEGLALGNGEVTLLEMAQAYAALANAGVYQPFHFLARQTGGRPPVRVFSGEAASLVGNIISDPWARRMEFGAGSVLNLPVQTAAKTGTSTDYRDAWTLAFNDRYVVGVWMGNLDNAPMKDVTGAVGPALAMRSIFAVLNSGREGARLYLSPRLHLANVCIRPKDAQGHCAMRSEWFFANSGPDMQASVAGRGGIEMVRPTEGLQIAYDPRIPATHQKFRFEVKGADGATKEWILDGASVSRGTESYYLWPVTTGRHSLSLVVEDTRSQAMPAKRVVGPVHFLVK